MGLFNRNKSGIRYGNVPADANLSVAPFNEPTLDEQSDEMKAIAIEYVVSLDKKDKDAFFEGLELIWQGYNNNVDKVRTRHQKALQRQARGSNGEVSTAEEDDDDLIASFLDDEPVIPPVTTTAKRPLGGTAIDIQKKD